MALTHAVRLYALVVIELAKKYTRSLILGFFIGFVCTFGFWRLYPVVFSLWFLPVERIGMVGDFTPTTLPATVQSLISTGLTQLSVDGTPRPGLADSWEATNSGKTFIFTLKNSKVWHSGEVVNAHDVNYNIRGVTFVPSDNETLVAHLQYPYSPFPTLVSKPIFLP